MTTRRFFTALGVVAVSALALAACRAEEQGRITDFKPGVYMGKKDTQISSAQVRELRQRSAYQGSSVYRSGGGSMIRESTVDLEKLKNRGRNQRRIR